MNQNYTEPLPVFFKPIITYHFPSIVAAKRAKNSSNPTTKFSCIFQPLSATGSSSQARMATQNDHTDQRPSSNAPASRASSCRKKNFGSGSFVSNLRDHIHEFLHASASEHRMCLKDTIQKMFEMSKAYREKSTGPTRESSPPL